MRDTTDASNLWIAAVLFETTHPTDHHLPPSCVMPPWLFVQQHNEADWEIDQDWGREGGEERQRKEIRRKEETDFMDISSQNTAVSMQ